VETGANWPYLSGSKRSHADSPTKPGQRSLPPSRLVERAPWRQTTAQTAAPSVSVPVGVVLERLVGVAVGSAGEPVPVGVGVTVPFGSAGLPGVSVGVGDGGTVGDGVGVAVGVGDGSGDGSGAVEEGGGAVSAPPLVDAPVCGARGAARSCAAAACPAAVDPEGDGVGVADGAGLEAPGPAVEVTRGKAAGDSRSGGAPPLVAASAIAMPEPEMAEASRRRTAIRRPGSARRCDRIRRSSPSAAKTTVSSSSKARSSPNDARDVSDDDRMVASSGAGHVGASPAAGHVGASPGPSQDAVSEASPDAAQVAASSDAGHVGASPAAGHVGASSHVDASCGPPQDAVSEASPAAAQVAASSYAGDVGASSDAGHVGASSGPSQDAVSEASSDAGHVGASSDLTIGSSDVRRACLASWR